jgi:hypothetical protein
MPGPTRLIRAHSQDHDGQQGSGAERRGALSEEPKDALMVRVAGCRGMDLSLASHASLACIGGGGGLVAPDVLRLFFKLIRLLVLLAVAGLVVLAIGGAHEWRALAEGLGIG